MRSIDAAYCYKENVVVCLCVDHELCNVFLRHGVR